MSYQNLTIHLFSGTGNSGLIADHLARRAGESGMETGLLPIDNVKHPPPPPDREGGLIGFIYPTHGFTAIWMMLLFILRYPRPQARTCAFAIITRGGFRIGKLCVPGLEGSGLYLPLLILWLKGYRIVGGTALDLPVSWIAVHPPLSPQTCRLIISRGQDRADRFFGDLLRGRSHFTGIPAAILGVVLLPITLAYLLLGRFFLAKLFIAGSNCNGCRICQIKCPVGAIRFIDNRPYWSFKCESCMRCLNSCPNRAIQACHSFGIILVLAAVQPADRWVSIILGLITNSGPIFLTPTLAVLIDYGYCFLAMYVAYRILHLVLGIRWINRFFEYTSLTRYYPRYEPPRAI